MREADHAASALEAEALLNALARELDKTHPSAAASLREGLAETSPPCAWACPRPWRGRCGRRTRSSR